VLLVSPLDERYEGGGTAASAALQRTVLNALRAEVHEMKSDALQPPQVTRGRAANTVVVGW
jgi:hypothetical protein